MNLLKRIFKSRKKKEEKIKYVHMPNFILDKRNKANIERRDRILKAEEEDRKYRTKLY